jgi:ATP-dependent DNA ligase
MILDELWVQPARPAEIRSKGDDFRRRVIFNDWLCEYKIDGYRCLVVHSNKGIHFMSRHKRPLKVNVDTSALMGIPADTILDGEWHRKEKRLYIFDAPIWAGRTTGDLRQRKGLIHYLPELGSIMKVPIVPEPSIQQLVWAKQRGYEGFVFKKIDARYPCGETREWLKCKK